ncbi:MAG: LysR family transcriptional regulator [Hyphomicrobiaceae bacterium]
MSTNIDGMVVFANIVAHGGVTAAARALKLPKSNVSRRLAQLEDKLGVRLLERTTRKTHLTEIGEIYYQHCRRIVEEIEHADLSIAQLLEVPRGTLRVSTSVTVGQHLIAPLLPGFIKTYPEVRMSLQLSNRRVDLVEEGYDLAIRVGQLEDSSLISRSLGGSELGVYGAAKYLEAHGVPKSPTALAKLDCLAMSHAETGHVWNLSGPSGLKHVEIKPRAIVNDFAVLEQMVHEGIGVALLPNYLAQSPKLIRVLPKWSVPFIELHAIYPSHRGATPKMRAFLDWLIDKLAHKFD